MELELEMKNMNVNISGNWATPDFQSAYYDAFERDNHHQTKGETDYFADSERVSFLEIRKNLEIVARVDVVNMDADERASESRRLLIKFPDGIISHYWWWEPKGIKKIEFFENQTDPPIKFINVAFIECYWGEVVVTRVNILGMTDSEEDAVLERLSKKWKKCPKRVFRGEWPVNKELNYFEDLQI